MASVNKVVLVGNLGRDPEVRAFPNGGHIANVTIATTERWRDKNTGENREQTEWHRVVFSDRLAEIAGQYLRKGSEVYVEGSVRTRKWSDPQTGQDRYVTEVRASRMLMLGQGEPSEQGRYEPVKEKSTIKIPPPLEKGQKKEEKKGSVFDEDYDDPPF